MNIILCGMMGAGKTSVGRKLAFLSNRRCVDTDEMIVSKYGPVNDIFARYGEAYFRDLETKVAERLSATDRLVIATGGGFVLRPQNVEFLKKSGKIVFLRATLSTLAGRVAGNGDRPLLKEGAEQKLKELLPVRTPVYESAADLIVDTDDKTVAAIAREILGAYGE